MDKTQKTRIDEVPQESEVTVTVTYNDIAERAYALFLSRGGEDGRDVEDWLQAERALLEEKNARHAA